MFTNPIMYKRIKKHKTTLQLYTERLVRDGLIPEGETEVSAAGLLKLPLAPLGRDALHQGNGVFLLERLRLQLPHPAVKPKHGRLTNHNMDVAGTLLDTGLQ